MSTYENLKFPEFLKLVSSKYKTGETFQVKVQFNPRGQGSEQILTAHIDCDGDLVTTNYDQHDIDGVDYSWCEMWSTDYTDHGGKFELIEPARTLRDMVIGDILVDEDGCQRTVLEVFSQTFIPTHATNKIVASGIYSFAEVEREGWKLIDPLAEPVVEKVETPKPKFKIGDVVIYRSPENNDIRYVISTISVIRLFKNGFSYTLPSGGDYSEMQLELYTD